MINKARIQRTGDGGVQPSRIQKVGSVHAGIKVLTKAVENIPGMREKYAEGLAAGASFDEIGAALKRVPGCPAKDPLTMKNVPYFTVRQGDFRTPGAAQTIMDAHATVRFPDPEPRLYDFPIVFPADDLDLVYRHEFVAWQASGKLRWSEMRGEDLVCMRQGDIPVDKTNRKRMGSIPAVVDRMCPGQDQEGEGENYCPLFATGKCLHYATLAFWIPGVLGVGAIELTFKSIYAKLGISDSLSTVMAGLGRISGLHNKKPIFWVSKSLDGVTRANTEKGTREKTDHWIIHVEASGLDMMEVLGAGQAQDALPAPAPVLAIEGPADPAAQTAPVADCESIPPATTTADPAIRELRAHLGALVSTLGWENDDLGEWMNGQGYQVEHPARDAGCLKDMVAKLAGIAEARRIREAAQVTETAAPAQGDSLTLEPDPVDDEEVPF